MEIWAEKAQLARLDLLVLDELGYVPTSKVGAELLFDVISTAYLRQWLSKRGTARRNRPGGRGSGSRK